jgi:branched-chain amino acid transport system ATP-binding protein
MRYPWRSPRRPTVPPAVAGGGPSGLPEPGGILLAIDSLSAGYGRYPVLHDVSARIRASSIVGLLGPNGAGKTTLLRSVCGQTTITAGTVSLAGQPLQSLRTYQIAERGVAHVVEGRGMLRGMSVRDNLLIGAYRRGGDIPARLGEVVEVFPRLGERLGQKAETLSGGEQQMLALGRGLMMNPVLMLLDEPSQGLSPVMIDLVIESVRAIRDRGVTIVLVEQVPDLLRRVCDEVLFVAGGQVSAPADPAALDPVLLRQLLTEGRFPQDGLPREQPPPSRSAARPAHHLTPATSLMPPGPKEPRT